MIIIPMAGGSSRFFKAGFDKPKYMLELWGRTLFENCIRTFESYFDNEEFIFIINESLTQASDVKKLVTLLRIQNFRIISVNYLTRGQADTVYLATAEYSNDEPVLIFNIDTILIGWEKANEVYGQNYLDVFLGSGLNWSNVELDKNQKVTRVTEKKQSSNYCCVGLYSFESAGLYNEIFLKSASMISEDEELYVAPLYNYIIESNQIVEMRLLDRSKIIFSGTPDEYELAQHMNDPYRCYMR